MTCNILNIVSIPCQVLTNEFIQLLTENYVPVWVDSGDDPKEHIYRIGDVIENTMPDETMYNYIQTLHDIEAMCAFNDTSFFRIELN